MRVAEQRRDSWSDGVWRQGFESGKTGLDCLKCGARIGARPELADRHRLWHLEVDARGEAPRAESISAGRPSRVDSEHGD